MLRCGTEHDHLVAASRLDDISDDHRDGIDATFVESLDDEALGDVGLEIRQLQGCLDHVVVDQPAYAVAEPSADHRPRPAP